MLHNLNWIDSTSELEKERERERDTDAGFGKIYFFKNKKKTPKLKLLSHHCLYHHYYCTCSPRCIIFAPFFISIILNVLFSPPQVLVAFARPSCCCTLFFHLSLNSLNSWKFFCAQKIQKYLLVFFLAQPKQTTIWTIFSHHAQLTCRDRSHTAE